MSETKQQRSSPVLLLTSMEGQDATIPALVKKATNIPVGEVIWKADAGAFDADVLAQLPAAKVVIIDLGALRDHGVALCTRIHQWRQDRQSKLKLMAVGGESAEEQEDAAYLAGCDMYLSRPLDRVEFLEGLRKLETWQLRGAHRAPVTAPLVWTHPDGSRCRGEVVDLSESGVLFQSEQPIPVSQNVPLEIQLPTGEPVLAWIRVVRTMPQDPPVATFTAKIAAEFLNLAKEGRAAVQAAIASVRQQEFLSRLETDYAETPIVVTDHQTEVIADWVHFLFTPVAFGNPPPPCGIPERTLKQWALRLPPNEEALFRTVEIDPDDRSSSAKWVRAWVGFRIRLHSISMQAQQLDELGNVDAFLKEARAALAVLSQSLTAWDLYEKDSPDANLNQERATVLLTLREGLLLRDAYDDCRSEDDPAFLEAIDRAEDFFSDRNFDATLATYERGAFREVRARRREKKREVSEKRPPRVRRTLAVLGILVVVLGGGVVINTMLQVKNKLVADDHILNEFPVLKTAGRSVGVGPVVFIGTVDSGMWGLKSVSERRQVADRLRNYLEIGEVRAAVVMNGETTVIQIESGRVLVVR